VRTAFADRYAVKREIGRGGMVLEDAREHLRNRPLDALPVDSILASQWDAGLRYIAAFGEGDRVLAEAGEPVGPRTGRMVGESDEIVDLGSRSRHFGMVPSPPGVGRGAGGRNVGGPRARDPQPAHVAEGPRATPRGAAR
ncbi:MAG: hypothetical protein ACREMQ_21880, partial [Longimicrobiales bacterium]